MPTDDLDERLNADVLAVRKNGVWNVTVNPHVGWLVSAKHEHLAVALRTAVGQLAREYKGKTGGSKDGN